MIDNQMIKNENIFKANQKDENEFLDTTDTAKIKRIDHYLFNIHTGKFVLIYFFSNFEDTIF